MNDEIKLYYDLTAETTADQWYKETILQPTIDEFMKLLPPYPAILDLGCGPGHESRRMAANGARVLGVDFSPECIRVARERTPECRFEVMDLRRLEERIGKFDGVWACASLIHINPCELPGVVQNIQSVLKIGGYAALIVQDGAGVKEEWSELTVGPYKLRRTVYCYTQEHLVFVAEPANLKFVCRGYLDESLEEQGWRNYIFRHIYEGE